MKEHIKVTDIGTQYDSERVVCITDEARSLLLDALHAEMNSIMDAARLGMELGGNDLIAEEKRKLQVAECLVVQIDDMKVV